jgi:hypothetical protein
MKVVNRNYSTFFDTTTNIQFDKTLDRVSGCYVAVAEVDKKTAKSYEDRAGFEVLTGAEYAEMTTTPEALEPDEPETGDPINDAAAQQAAANGEQSQPPGPPKPPASS